MGENIASVQMCGSMKWDHLRSVLRLIVHLFLSALTEVKVIIFVAPLVDKS
jgi:hypothetical protein